MIKENDIVIISDASYSYAIREQELRKLYSRSVPCYEKYKVLKLGCSIFPPNPGSRWLTDTILLKLDTNEILFACSKGLCLATHVITIDGKDIVISQESYKNLREQLVEDN